MTLPLIYTLNNTDLKTKREIIYIVKNKNRDKSKVKFVIDQVIAAGGMEYAAKKMIEHRDSALSVLNNYPVTPVRDALTELVRFTTDRKF